MDSTIGSRVSYLQLVSALKMSRTEQIQVWRKKSHLILKVLLANIRFKTSSSIWVVQRQVSKMKTYLRVQLAMDLIGLNTGLIQQRMIFSRVTITVLTMIWRGKIIMISQFLILILWMMSYSKASIFENIQKRFSIETSTLNCKSEVGITKPWCKNTKDYTPSISPKASSEKSSKLRWCWKRGEEIWRKDGFQATLKNSSSSIGNAVQVLSSSRWYASPSSFC